MYSDASAPLQVGTEEEPQFKSNVKIDEQSADATEDFLAAPIAEARCCSVSVSRELQSDTSDRHTRHLEFALPETFNYVTGDHLGVCPVNSQSLIDAIGARLGVDLKKKVKLSLIDTSFASKKSTLPLNVVTSIQ